MHPLTSYLYDLIHVKRSNLCVSADITTVNGMLSLAEKVGPSIVVFKTHADMLTGWDPDIKTGTGAKLAAIARRHRFLIFEDRKYADIGFTVQLQYAGGDHRILDWAHIVNAHILPGPDIVRALKETANSWMDRENILIENSDNYSLDPSPFSIEEPPSERALLLLAQMSSAGNFLDAAYTSSCVSIARQNQDFVMGFIALKPVSQPEEAFIVMAPGCSLSREESIDGSEFPAGSEDSLGQQYIHPRDLIFRGCDIIIVGTGICNANNPAAKAEQYRDVAWKAYEKREGPGALSVPVWLPSMV